MENEKNWYLISTKIGCETKVAQALERLNVITYVPVQKQVVRLSNNKRFGRKVLFPSFVFVYAALQDHVRIRKIDNVVSVMFWLNTPVIIGSEEITNIQNFIRNHNNITVEKLSINHTGKYSLQFLQESNNDIFETEERTEKLMLSSIGYSLTATSSVLQFLEVA